MSTATRDDLHRLVDALPDQEIPVARRMLAELVFLSSEGEIDSAIFEQLRASIGRPTAVVPANPFTSVDEMRADFWPEDEDPDEFDRWLNELRGRDLRG